MSCPYVCDVFPIIHFAHDWEAEAAAGSGVCPQSPVINVKSFYKPHFLSHILLPFPLHLSFYVSLLPAHFCINKWSTGNVCLPPIKKIGL